MQEIKVGDRVRLLNDGGYSGPQFFAGATGTVLRRSGPRLVCVSVDGDERYGAECLNFFVGLEVEKIEPAVRSIEVGGKARVLTDGGLWGHHYRRGDIVTIVARCHSGGWEVSGPYKYRQRIPDGELEPVDEAPAAEQNTPKSRQRRFNEAQNIAKRAVAEAQGLKVRTVTEMLSPTAPILFGRAAVGRTRDMYRAAYRAVRLMQQQQEAA